MDYDPFLHYDLILRMPRCVQVSSDHCSDFLFRRFHGNLYFMEAQFLWAN